MKIEGENGSDFYFDEYFDADGKMFICAEVGITCLIEDWIDSGDVTKIRDHLNNLLGE